MPAPNPFAPAHRALLLLAALLLAIGLAVGVTSWNSAADAEKHFEAQRQANSARREQARNEARAAWAKLLTEEEQKLADQRRQALEPVDEYFDTVALPHIGDFLADFTGLFYDTPRFVYKWIADKVRFRGYSDRVTQQVKAALAKHLGFPDKFNASVRASLERYHTLEQQRDAELRERAYTLLQGAGASVDRARLDELLKNARDAAEHTAFEQRAKDSAIDFGGVMAGKEVAMVAVQTLIVARVMVAVGTRLGVVTTGAGAATATAGVGTATGVGAVPSWVLAAGEIVVTVIIDLAVGWWLENKAEATMQKHLEEVRAETRTQLDQYMQSYAEGLKAERTKLMDTALTH